LEISCYKIHSYKETENYSQEEIEKKKERMKVGKCSSAKEVWDKLHNLYFEESPITKPNNYKEDERREQEEIQSSCQIDSKEEDCEEGIVYLEEELINSLDELTK
jgi:type IV secretory pathway component VirB8